MKDAYRTADVPVRPAEDVFAACAPLLRKLSPDDRRRVLQSLEIFLRDEKRSDS